MTIEKREYPKSEAELERLLEKAYDYARKSDYPRALELCDWLIQEKSTEIAGYRKRAAVREHMGDIDGAIGDLQRVIASASVEPGDFYGLGLLLFQRGEAAQAVASFTRAIEIGSKAGFDYYTQGALIFRAEAYLKLCDFENAISDCSALPAGYKTYIGGSSGMRSREDILGEANAALKSKGRQR